MAPPKKTVKGYGGNPNLKRAGEVQDFTEQDIKEYIRCKNDIVYFCRNYVKIITVDDGLELFDPLPFQLELFRTIQDNRFTLSKMARQAGKSTALWAYILHYIIFQSGKSVALLGNEGAIAREILRRLKYAYERLPLWLQMGVVVWNKGSIELENGSRVKATSTTGNAARGDTYNLVILDEFAFISRSIAHDFYTSVLPTITAGQHSKMVIISTPNGKNHFYRLWIDAEAGKNAYQTVTADWRDVPGRDEEWKRDIIAAWGEGGAIKFKQEFECQFIGNAHSLIAPEILSSMNSHIGEIIEAKSHHGLHVYTAPVVEHQYFITVDVSGGSGRDYSVVNVFDVTQSPFEQVAIFRRNDIPPALLPDWIRYLGVAYHNAPVLIEANFSDHIFHSLENDHGYENVLKTRNQQGRGQTLSYGFASTKVKPGLNMTVPVRQICCSRLSDLIFHGKLLLRDIQSQRELETFVWSGQRYEAEAGYYDDIVITLGLFAWATTQGLFKDYLREGEAKIDDLRREVYEKSIEELKIDHKKIGLIDEDDYPMGSPEPISRPRSDNDDWRSMM